jgi:hypothetical protein
MSPKTTPMQASAAGAQACARWEWFTVLVFAIANSGPLAGQPIVLA